MSGRSKFVGPQRHNQPVPSQRVVREGGLSREFMLHDEQIAAKTSLLLQAYHRKLVEPRLRWLEMPWYRKLAVRIIRVVVAVSAWVRSFRAQPAPALAGGESPKPPEPKAEVLAAPGPAGKVIAVLDTGKEVPPDTPMPPQILGPDGLPPEPEEGPEA